MSRDELDALEKCLKASTPYDYGNDGKLRAFGCYLTTRPDISMNVEHIREMGQKRFGLPFQAIPFGIDRDAEAVALAWNAIPELIAQAREALELREAALSLARILERILDDIPARRDWLDPDLERVARDVINNARRGK